MGFSSLDLDIFIYLKENGYIKKNASVIEIGAQQISNNLFAATPQLHKIEQLFGVALPTHFSGPIASNFAHGVLEHLESNALPSREFWKWLNFNYAAIDIDESPDSIPLDLNYDSIPEESRGKYDLVTNFGTTEHVANQLNAFKVIHELTAVGGVMMHNLPAQGMMNHGIVNYNPKFFWMLSRSNGYKWLYSDYTTSTAYYELPQNIIDNILPFNPNIISRSKECQIADCAVVVAMQKIYDSPYVPPLDVPTNLKTNNKILEERYWSVFKPNPFQQFHDQLPPMDKAKSFIAKVIRKLKAVT